MLDSYGLAATYLGGAKVSNIITFNFKYHFGLLLLHLLRWVLLSSGTHLLYTSKASSNLSFGFWLLRVLSWPFRGREAPRPSMYLQ